MKRITQVWFLLVCLMAMPAFAAGNKGMIDRGGLGYLFPDHNSFRNASQFATDKGTGVEVAYQKVGSPVTTTTTSQSIAPSVVYGSGTFGLGVTGSRTGSSITDTTNKTDSIQVGMGVAAAKQRLTLGVDFYRNLEATRTEDGIVNASIAWNPDKKHGFAIGAQAGMALNSTSTLLPTKTGVASIGYSFNPNANVEGFVNFYDLNNTSNIGFGGAVSFTGHMFYLSGRFDYAKLAAISTTSGRVGVILGQIDLSAYVVYFMNSGSTPGYGASLRFAF